MTDMTDDPTQNPTVLASAYLDGEAAPGERALVESSPELLAEVEQLRVVRSIVSESVEPAALSAREAHLAAALDVFDQLGTTPAGASHAASLDARRARRERRRDRAPGERSKLLLGTAAGLVVLAGAGAVIRGVIVGSNATDGTDDLAAEEAPDDEPADELLGPAESDVFTELEGGNTNDELRTEVDAGEVAQDLAEEDAPAEEPAEDAEASAAEELADDASVDESDDASSPEDAPPEVDAVELLTPQDLADLAAPAAYAPAQDGSDPVDLESAFSDCFAAPPAGLGIDRLAESAFVAGELVNVGADLDTGLAFAFRDDCSVVLDAILPSEEDFLAARPDVTTTTAAP